MSFEAADIEIIPVERVEIAVEPKRWEFARARRREIDRHFAARRREQPALWNGRVLLLDRYEIAGGVLRGACFETDYASFTAWRDWDFADRGVANVFAVAALRAADGAFLVGEMAPYTAGAGQLCCPCGTPDPDDVGVDGSLDLFASLGRELREETGLDIGTLAVEPGWNLVRDRGFMALMKRLTANQEADELRARLARHLASEARPEFSAIRIVRGRADLDPQMPRYLVAFFAAVWRQRLCAAMRVKRR